MFEKNRKEGFVNGYLNPLILVFGPGKTEPSLFLDLVCVHSVQATHNENAKKSTKM